MTPPRDLSIVSALGLLVACAPTFGSAPALQPSVYPPPALEATATPVAATVDATRQAVLIVLARRRIPVRALDREGGPIVAGPLSADPTRGPTWGECGRMIKSWEPKPTKGEVTVLARSEGPGSAIRITTRWTVTTWDVTQQCEARGGWEQELEREVKQKAERAGKAP